MSLDVLIIISLYLTISVLLFSAIEIIILRRGHETDRIHVKEILNTYMICLIWPISIVVWSVGYDVRFKFVWHDIFVGFYIDIKNGKVYIVPFPCCVYSVEPFVTLDEG